MIYCPGGTIGFNPAAGRASESAPKSKELVPEGRCDRSLARSAWEVSSQESRPVGYGLIREGERTDSSDWRIGVTKFRNTKLKKFVLYYFHLTFLKNHSTHFDEKHVWD